MVVRESWGSNLCTEIVLPLLSEMGIFVFFLTAGMADDSVSNLLIVVVDINPLQRIVRDQPSRISQILETVVTFSNMHLMLESKNKLAIIGCHSRRSEFLYVDDDTHINTHGPVARQSDSQYEKFSAVDQTVKYNLRRFVLDDESLMRNISEKEEESLLAGSLAKALCYIHRIERELRTGEKLNSRILTVTGSVDGASQYMNYMNVFFTSQKQNVVLDVCSLDCELGLLRQGCDITGGMFLRIPHFQGLLQYLLWVFLPEPSVREKLVLPPPAKVDYRAACFCHRTLINIGYVCSVCLSIFCKFSPICTTCNTVFKPPPLQLKKKKKFKKV